MIDRDSQVLSLILGLDLVNVCSVLEVTSLKPPLSLSPLSSLLGNGGVSAVSAISAVDPLSIIDRGYYFYCSDRYGTKPTGPDSCQGQSVLSHIGLNNTDYRYTDF